MNRRNSAENIIFQNSNEPKVLYKVKERKNEKSNDSRNSLLSGFGSTMIPSSSMNTMTLDHLKKIYSYNTLNSPQSIHTSKYNTLKAGSPKNIQYGSTRGHNSVLHRPNQNSGTFLDNCKANNHLMTTQTMLSLFKDMSKHVSQKLQTKHQNLSEIYD